MPFIQHPKTPLKPVEFMSDLRLSFINRAGTVKIYTSALQILLSHSLIEQVFYNYTCIYIELDVRLHGSVGKEFVRHKLLSATVHIWQ